MMAGILCGVYVWQISFHLLQIILLREILYYTEREIMLHREIIQSERLFYTERLYST